MPQPVDTNPFARVLVEYKAQGGTIVSWELDRHFVDPQPWVFQLQYNRGQVVGLPEDWADAGLPQTNAFAAVDEAKRLYGKGFDLGYRIVLTTPLGVYYARPSAVRRWDRYDWCVTREIIRKELLLADRFTAVAGYYLKAKRVGAVCPACIDALTGECLNSDCETCRGTGMLGGYYAAVPSRYVDLTNTSTREQRGDTGTERKAVRMGRFVDFPMPVQGDAWVNRDSDERFYVHKVEEKAVRRGFAYIWDVELRPAPFTDVLYTVPLEGS